MPPKQTTVTHRYSQWWWST